MTDTQTPFKSRVLSIETEASVVLASRKIPLEEVLSMTTGTMLRFEMSCDEPLVLKAGDHPLATGEAVKVGDKFGIRIREFIRKED